MGHTAHLSHVAAISAVQLSLINIKIWGKFSCKNYLVCPEIHKLMFFPPLNGHLLIPTKVETCSIESLGYDLHKFEF